MSSTCKTGEHSRDDGRWEEDRSVARLRRILSYLSFISSRQALLFWLQCLNIELSRMYRTDFHYLGISRVMKLIDARTEALKSPPQIQHEQS